MQIVPQENAQTLETFQAGDIDGAWVPEPWATRLVQEGGGKVLVDERDLWPDGKFVTTHLIVRTEFLEEHPDVVKHAARGPGRRPTTSSTPSPTEAKAMVNARHRARSPASRSAAEVIDAAWKNLHVHRRPDRRVAGSLGHARRRAVGLLEPIDLRASTT